MNFSRELQVARAAAGAAGAAQLEARSNRLQIDIKDDASPVTQVDRHCESLIRDSLAEAFPDDGFLGEESGSGISRSGRTWIVDPLDGTRPFIRGIPTYSCLVALEADGEPVVGVMCLPEFNVTYWAAKGSGAFCAGRPIRVSESRSFKQAIGSGFGYIQQAGTPQAERLLALMGQWDYAYGFMDNYTYALIADGRLDLCVNLLDRPWDCAAAACIVAEAGGEYSDIEGNRSIHNGSVVLSNGYLHDAILDAIRAV